MENVNGKNVEATEDNEDNDIDDVVDMVLVLAMTRTGQDDSLIDII